jgi:hypothetical protein
MRLSYSLILAGALFAAAPAMAQDNAAAPDNNVAANSADMNAAANQAMPPPAAMTPAQPEAAPPAQNAATADAGATRTHRGFPWGVLGLLGLIGLFGVRKVKG